MERRFRLGFLVNPFAGVGGPTAKKGSDAAEVQLAAQAGEFELTAPARALDFLNALISDVPSETVVDIVSVAGDMGGSYLELLGAQATYITYQAIMPTTAKDTANVVKELIGHGIDLLVFVGGDGTARTVCETIGPTFPALGVPAGVKMQSAVYAINPRAAARIVHLLMTGALVTVGEHEVRDLDEEAYKKGVVKSRFYGCLSVPDESALVQNIKQGGIAVEELLIADIADGLMDELPDEALIILGPGSTMQKLSECWDWPSTLLGVDVFTNSGLVALDVDADRLESLAFSHAGPVVLILTVIGGQGHIIGRGNQQIRASLLSFIGRHNLKVIASRDKLQTLQGRPLLIDSGDARLDRAWSGLMPVISGYNDSVLYMVGHD